VGGDRRNIKGHQRPTPCINRALLQGKFQLTILANTGAGDPVPLAQLISCSGLQISAIQLQCNQFALS
jgi:hypothetical protein